MAPLPFRRIDLSALATTLDQPEHEAHHQNDDEDSHAAGNRGRDRSANRINDRIRIDRNRAIGTGGHKISRASGEPHKRSRRHRDKRRRLTADRLHTFTDFLEKLLHDTFPFLLFVLDIPKVSIAAAPDC